MTFSRNKVLDKQPWVFYDVPSKVTTGRPWETADANNDKRTGKAGLSTILDSKLNT